MMAFFIAVFSILFSFAETPHVFLFIPQCGYISESEIPKYQELTPTNDYFNFSELVHEVTKYNGNFVLEFYEDESIKDKPVFVLNKDGLLKDNQLLCSWKLPFNKANLGRNTLEGCISIQTFLGFIVKTSQQEIHACPVLNVSSAKLKDKIYSYKVQIGSEDYFLKVQNFPSVARGEIFLDEARRKKIFATELLKKRSSAKARIDQIVKSDSIKKLKACLNSKTMSSCIEGFVSTEFRKEIIERLNVCSYQNQKEFESCLNGAELQKLEYEYLNSFMMSVQKLSIDKFDSPSEEKYNPNDFNLLYYPGKKFHENGNENEFIKIRYKEGIMVIEEFHTNQAR